MEKYSLDVFELAEQQLQKEVGNRTRKTYTMLDVLDYAVIIRDYMIKQRTNTALAKRRWSKV